MFDASQSTVMRAAVSAVINAGLAKNEGIRERYEKVGRARREGTATKVHPSRQENDRDNPLIHKMRDTTLKRRDMSPQGPDQPFGMRYPIRYPKPQRGFSFGLGWL
jgi:hypothetical protein